MTKDEAIATISDIGEDVIERRGDMAASQVGVWGVAYSHWADAAELLTAEEITDAIHVGRLRVID